MNNDTTLPPLRDVIARYDLAARRSLGQHFLLDLNLTGRIARSAGDITSGTTIEIGPGPGGLTRALLDNGAHVVAIERDTRCLDALTEVAQAYPDRLQLIEADALTVDIGTLGPAPRRIVANLPYNISTVLLLKWLRQLDDISDMTLMFQKEVVDRLTAAPRSKDYGRLTIITGWLCEVRAQFDVHPQAFTPPPKVTSTVVRLIPRAEPLAPASFATMERVTAAAFGQRRKMLRSSLKALGDAQALCAAADLPPTARAEEIDIFGFCALARAVDAGVGGELL